MATTVISGAKDRQIPGIDGGSFLVNPVQNVVIKVKMKYVRAVIVSPTVSGGTAPTNTATVGALFNTGTSAGFSILSATPASNLQAGITYEWIAYGIGG